MSRETGPGQPEPAKAVVRGASPLAGLVRGWVLDAELGALLWLLAEVRTPVVVAGPPGSGRRAMIDALRELLPPETEVVPITGDDDFERMPEAVELGWRRERRGGVGPADRVSAANAVLLAPHLGDGEAGGPAGERARIVVRALSLGYGLLATMSGAGLDDVLDRLADASIGTDDDERSRLGVVVAMAPETATSGPRVVAAHYVRPTARDQHGHVQRFAPAVLASWNPSTGRLDHFAWGILPELAVRLGMRPIELEHEQARRASRLRQEITHPV